MHTYIYRFDNTLINQNMNTYAIYFILECVRIFDGRQWNVCYKLIIKYIVLYFSNTFLYLLHAPALSINEVNGVIIDSIKKTVFKTYVDNKATLIFKYAAAWFRQVPSKSHKKCTVIRLRESDIQLQKERSEFAVHSANKPAVIKNRDRKTKSESALREDTGLEHDRLVTCDRAERYQDHWGISKV